MQRHFPKTEVGDAVNYRADRSATEGVFPDARAFSLIRLICFDRHNRFDHHDFRGMDAPHIDGMGVIQPSGC
jgi:hypothetical protein